MAVGQRLDPFEPTVTVMGPDSIPLLPFNELGGVSEGAPTEAQLGGAVVDVVDVEVVDVVDVVDVEVLVVEGRLNGRPTMAIRETADTRAGTKLDPMKLSARMGHETVTSTRSVSTAAERQDSAASEPPARQRVVTTTPGMEPSRRVTAVVINDESVEVLQAPIVESAHR